jgi:hypothetical protein
MGKVISHLLGPICTPRHRDRSCTQWHRSCGVSGDDIDDVVVRLLSHGFHGLLDSLNVSAVHLQVIVHERTTWRSFWRLPEIVSVRILLMQTSVCN